MQVKCIMGKTLLHMILSVFVLLICLKQVNSQDKPEVLVQYEDTLLKCFRNIIASPVDSVKMEYNKVFKDYFIMVVNQVASFDYPFDSLKNVGKIVSPDKTFRIYNWNLAYSDGSYEYFGIIQKYSKKHKRFIITELIDNSKNIINPEQLILTNDNWFGALYYSIIPVKSGKNTYYTLLGWDGNNDFTTIKLIDIVSFSRSGKPKFGKNIFVLGKTKKKRIIFEFSYLASMSLRYHEKNKMIIYDHLAPSSPKYEGRYQFYGPDFSYDALYFKNGKWNYQSDIDVRNPKVKQQKKKNISFTF